MHSVADGYSVLDNSSEHSMPRPEPLAQPEGTYWHFLEASRVLRFGDGRKVVPGVTLIAPAPPVLCKSGMHASRLVLDALNVAPGPVACLVTLGGKNLHAASQSVAESRTVLWMYDADHLLREFACDVAESALLSERKDGREPDARLWAAITIMRRFLRGEVTETEQHNAWLAADSASYDAAGAVAKCIAVAAAWGRNPACEVVRGVTRDVSWDAGRAAVRNGFNERLTQMLLCARAKGLGEFAASKNNAEKDRV